jgi:hypothetical protein
MSHSLSTQARCVCERGRCVCERAQCEHLRAHTVQSYYFGLLRNTSCQWLGHKRRTHQRHERSVKAAVSGFSPCALTCNFTDCEAHNGLDRAQNSNLSPLTSETMWYQPILIEHLAVLLLLQQHTHFSSSRRVSMWTLVVAKSKEFTRLPYTGLVLELEHLKVEPRLINESFANAMGECEN